MKAGEIKRIKGTFINCTLIEQTGVHGEGTWYASSETNPYFVIHESELCYTVYDTVVRILSVFFDWEESEVKSFLLRLKIGSLLIGSIIVGVIIGHLINL